MKIIENKNTVITIRFSCIANLYKKHYVFYKCPKKFLHKNISLKYNDPAKTELSLRTYEIELGYKKVYDVINYANENDPIKTYLEYNSNKNKIFSIDSFAISRSEYFKVKEFLSNLSKIIEPQKIVKYKIPKPNLIVSNSILGLQLE